MNTKNFSSPKEMKKDAYDAYLEPFKHLETVNRRNKSMFSELLQYTNENIKSTDKEE